MKIIKIEKKVSFEDGKKTISMEPNKISLDIDYEIKYSNSLIGTQRNLIKVYEDDLTEVYNSRTFCLFEDVEKLKKMNLAKGGTLENAVVVKGQKILNKNGLRNKKEFVNHKILDCMGDLYLAGYKIIGKLVCSQGGHKLTNQLLRRVFEDNTNFSIIEVKEKNIPHSLINRNILKSIA
jgi:UDP-3-O-[3-hydroxymyristoyl] N-acetylglucosamine deacetylase